MSQTLKSLLESGNDLIACHRDKILALAMTWLEGLGDPILCAALVGLAKESRPSVHQNITQLSSSPVGTASYPIKSGNDLLATLIIEVDSKVNGFLEFRIHQGWEKKPISAITLQRLIIALKRAEASIWVG